LADRAPALAGQAVERQAALGVRALHQVVTERHDFFANFFQQHRARVTSSPAIERDNLAPRQPVCEASAHCGCAYDSN